MVKTKAQKNKTKNWIMNVYKVPVTEAFVLFLSDFQFG